MGKHRHRIGITAIVLLAALVGLSVPAEARHINLEDLHCPTDVQAEALADGSIRLTWTPDTEDAAAADEFTIRRSVDGGEAELIATVDGNATEFVDTDTEPGHAFTYEIVPEGLKLFSPRDGCQTVTATAVPFFPGMLGGIAAGAAALVGFVVLRRRA